MALKLSPWAMPARISSRSTSESRAGEGFQSRSWVDIEGLKAPRTVIHVRPIFLAILSSAQPNFRSRSISTRSSTDNLVATATPLARVQPAWLEPQADLAMIP
jgi:hypothetical protein